MPVRLARWNPELRRNRRRPLKLSAPILRWRVFQLEFNVLDAGYRSDHGAETLLNGAKAAGSTAAPALLTDDRAGQGHDSVAHHNGNRIRWNVGRSSQGRFDPFLEQLVGHTRRAGTESQYGTEADRDGEMER